MATLVNRTPLPAAVHMGDDIPGYGRAALMMAKATFRAREDGALVLDDQEPMALLYQDTPYDDLGTLPSDMSFGRPGRVELFVYGAAIPPGGWPARQLRVGLEVGEHRWQLRVVGDRQWRHHGDSFRPTAPEPFTRMPVTWERAFGGTVRAALSPTVSVDLPFVENPVGTGYLPLEAALEQVGGAIRGYPRLAIEGASLPNVLRVEEPALQSPSQQSAPLAWSAVPMTSSRLTDAVAEDTVPDAARMPRGPEELRLPGFEAGAKVKVSGFDANGDWVFSLPALEVMADYESPHRCGSKRLEPQAIQLFPNERRLVLLFRRASRAPAGDGPFRFRLRLPECEVRS